MTGTLPINKDALKTALGMLAAVKPSLDILRGRTVTNVGNLMGTRDMPIAQFLTLAKKLKPIPVQRNDLFRLDNGLARHLGTFELPQASLVLAYWKGKLWVLDGNTRIRHWLENMGSELPSRVTVTVLVVSSADEATRYYNCYDASVSRKTKRDSLLGMFRDAGLNPELLGSKLAAGGKLLGVMQHITRQHHGGSASPKRLQETVIEYLEVIPDLDRLNLDETEICLGGIWALMRLYRELPREFYSYIDSYAGELRKLRSTSGLLIAESVLDTHDAARRACRTVGTGRAGSQVVPVTFPEYFAGFWLYSRQLVRSGRADAKFSKYLPRLKKNVIEPEVSRAKAVLSRAYFAAA
jgi:hypothetical protein